MRIVIDCFKLIRGHGKSQGIYNLALNLSRNIARNLSAEDELLILGNEYNASDFDMEGCEFVRIDNPNPLSKAGCVVWELFMAPTKARKLKADVILYPRGFCGLIHPVKDAIIIHDMIPFFYHEHFPQVFNRLENAYIMSRLRSSARTCSRIITISEASKRDIVKYSKVNEDKILVINNGCNFIENDDLAGLSGDDEPYIVAITSSLPHKNAAGIIQAYDRYRDIADCPIKLKIIGIDRDKAMSLNGDRCPDGIDFLGFINDDRALYGIIKGAKAFLFLSLAEGFGFPPIEAMQLGVPVICSNTSSLPEVVGNAGILVDPTDTQAIADSIVRLLSDERLQSELINKGFDNIKRFNWDDISFKYINELRRI